MKAFTLTNILLLTALLIALLSICTAIFTTPKNLKIHTLAFLSNIFGAPTAFTANAESSTGTHKVLTRLADAAHSYTHLLVKAGSDSDHVAVCGASNYPIGTTTDAPEAAEDPLNVSPLGIGECTRKVRVATGISADVDLYTAASGFAQGEPTTAGTFYKIGRSIAAAVQVGSGDYTIEFAPCAPKKVVVAAQMGVYVVAVPVTLASITGANDVLTNYTPGHAFKVLAADWAQGTPVTTAAKAVTLNLEINTTNLTGGVISLTSATCTPLGNLIAGTAVTANNTGTATDTISVEASGVTAFVEGNGYVLIKIQNLDTANAFAAWLP